MQVYVPDPVFTVRVVETKPDHFDYRSWTWYAEVLVGDVPVFACEYGYGVSSNGYDVDCEEDAQRAVLEEFGEKLKALLA
jgi:hypothetical protein